MKKLAMSLGLLGFLWCAPMLYAADFVAKPLVGNALNAFNVALQLSDLPSNLASLKAAKLYRQQYLAVGPANNQVYYQVYNLDANNDGAMLEYIVTKVQLKTNKNSAVLEVFEIQQGGQLVALNFNQLAAKALQLGSSLQACQNWYCSLAQPFLLYQNKTWLMRFQSQNGQICQYVWQNHNFSNVPVLKGCIN